jgi:hypothetical protein
VSVLLLCLKRRAQRGREDVLQGWFCFFTALARTLLSIYLLITLLFFLILSQVITCYVISSRLVSCGVRDKIKE